jgi:GNAT superfamily N-acetyltransferase
MIIQPRVATDDDLVGLLAEQVAEMTHRYGEAPLPVHPAASFMVAVIGSTAIGCGAIQPVAPDTAELKRMYVRPDHRGRGVGRRLLSALEALAVSSGYGIVRLETGIRQPEAIGLYESAGYIAIPRYGAYISDPLSRCFAKAVGTMLVSSR